MPIYEYQCVSCGHTFEQIQKISEKPVAQCPKCKKGVQKLVSKAAFHLKGAGWYVTDYKKSSQSSKEEVKTEPKTEEKKGIPSEKNKTKKEET